VVMWTTVRLIITLVTIKGWHSRQLDFILAYPQADMDRDIYMKLLKGFKIKEKQSKEGYCLKLLKNIYGLKQAGRVWNQHLHKGLLRLKLLPVKTLSLPILSEGHNAGGVHR